jgi:hypothetical protein
MAPIKRGFWFFIFSLLIFLPFGFAQTEGFSHVVSNSENWKDVYSAVHFANLKGVDSDFLVSTGHGPLLLNGVKKENSIFVVTSKDEPYVFNYPDMITGRGFKGASEILVDDANIELIEELDDIENFIVVGDSYGFNAIAVAPLAVKTRAWVFLSNRFNINEIGAILSRRDIDSIIIYGYVDREVREILEKYNPDIIDNSDRFKDNIEIVERYLEVNPTRQIVLSNGEFIEKEIMKGLEPVLFTGRENVPDQIRDYLKDSDIKIGVLIGNDLVGAATNIRRSTGVSVMVKFARGARTQAGGIAAVEGLDLFPLPTPYIKLLLHSIKFNKVSSQLEVTYKSDSNVPVYFKGTITLFEGDESTRVGDINPIFTAPGDYKTVVYNVNVSNSENLEAELSTLYGESPSALDRMLRGRLEVDVVDVIDRCKLDEEDIKWVKYNKQKNSFFVNVKNPTDVDCWVDLELEDIEIGLSEITIGTEGSVRIPKGDTKKIGIPEELTDEDLERNPSVNLLAFSGEREDSLVHTFKGTYPLQIELLSVLAYMTIALAVIIAVLLILIILLRKRERDF